MRRKEKETGSVLINGRLGARSVHVHDARQPHRPKQFVVTVTSGSENGRKERSIE